MSSQGVHWFLFDIREVLTLCCSSAGSMGLDVPKTNLVVVNSCPPSAWEFSQQVLFETCYFYQFLAISTPMNPACHCSLIKWPLLFTDDQSFTFDVHYISLTYTALTGAISLTQMIISVRQGTDPSISNVIWILSSDTDTAICLLSQLFQIVRRQCCLRSKGDIFKIYWVTQ